MSGKKLKFNIVDGIILVVILAIAFFAGSKMFSKNEDVTAEEVTATLSFYCEEVPEYAAELLKVGDKVSDEGKNVALGEITSLTVENALTYGIDAEGKSVTSEKKGYKSVKLTTEIKASEFAHGIIADTIKYSVGHPLTLYAGKAKMSARVSGIEIK